jgi:hypothetical protein
LERGSEVCPHGWADVPIDAVHTGHLVAHALGFQDFGNAVFIHPGLVAVAQPWGVTP